MRLSTATPDTAATTGDPVTVTRRRFLRVLVGFSVVSTVGMIVTPVLGFLVPTKSSASAAGGKVSAGKLAELPIGKGKVIPVGGKPAIVINTDQGVKAYSAVCTHLGCIVGWDETSRNVVCPCHDGRFNPANGSVVSGPPPAPLSPLTATVENDEIFLVAG